MSPDRPIGFNYGEGKTNSVGLRNILALVTKRIRVGDLKRSYAGRPGCACGCRGTYSPSKGVALNRVRAVKQGGAVQVALGGSVRDEPYVTFDTEWPEKLITFYFKLGTTLSPDFDYSLADEVGR